MMLCRLFAGVRAAMSHSLPFFVGFAGLVVLWLVIGVASSFNVSKLFEGQDKRPSSSKFQFLLWTAVIVFGYLVVYSTPDKSGNYRFSPLEGLPSNLLIAMGISGATAVAAKAITTSNVASGKHKTAFDSTADRTIDGMRAIRGGIFQGDDGAPDLGKVQMILWTVISVGVFLASVVQNVYAPDPSRTLPDIGQTLMILMGLGHATYVGKKIAE